ncbi:MAG: hypothetical protein KHY93_15865 [Clostridiales bacterium]|nr:hypothetical protein [Clostridiales bacterium]
MYRNLVLFRNELKNNKMPKYKMEGIVSEMLISRDIFKKNSEIKNFLNYVFDLDYKDYVMKSRTLIVARTVKTIHNSEETEYNLYKKKLMVFTSKAIEDWKDREGSKENRNEFNGWINNRK